jgi:methylglutamate dehydrogenase subunit D
VSDFTLTARSPLQGFDKDINGVRIVELPEFALVSIAVGDGQVKSLATKMKAAFGLALPAAGKTTSSKDYSLISSAAGQWLLRFAHQGPADPSAMVREKLGAGPAITDQTGNWVQVEVSGPRAVEALERVCPLNLQDAAFDKGCAGRTSMEHLGAIICRLSTQQTYLLMSASSSATSFAHALEVSAINIGA